MAGIRTCNRESHAIVYMPYLGPNSGASHVICCCKLQMLNILMLVVPVHSEHNVHAFDVC